MAVHPNSLANLKKRNQYRSGEDAKTNGSKGGAAKKRKEDEIKAHAAALRQTLLEPGYNGQTIQENLDRALFQLVINREQGAVAAYEKLMEYAGLSPNLELKKDEQKRRREELKLRKQQQAQPAANDTAVNAWADVLGQIRSVMEEEDNETPADG